MPELPEVETTASDLRPDIVGQQITGVHVLWERTVAEPGAGALVELLPGQRIIDVGRRGKYIMMALDSGMTLICHLRMTGRLRVEPGGDEAGAEPPDVEPYVRAWFDLGDGRRLVFADMRKFGRIWLAGNRQDVVGKLGPEPLDPGFTAEVLGDRLRRRHPAIKALLLDQTVVAGLGNIYADEALHSAGIHPLRRGDSLAEDEVVRLHAAIVTVLNAAVRGRGTTLRDYRPPYGERGNFFDELKVYQRTDQPCVKCGEPIRRIRVTQRSTHFCPRCQPEPL